MEGEHHKNVYYVCEGTCGAKLTEDEYRDHPAKVCGTEGCTHKGREFVRKEIIGGQEKDVNCKHCAHCQMCGARNNG